MKRSLSLLTFVFLLAASLSGQVMVIDVPGASTTYIVGINNGGDVTGYWVYRHAHALGALRVGKYLRFTEERIVASLEKEDLFRFGVKR
jgi:hypothetical protein